MSPPVQLGPFLLGPALGAGGTGTVFHATHAPTGTPAAVKVVRRSADHQPMRHNLAAEVRAVVALDHPHIIQVYDLGEVDASAAAADPELVEGTPWFAMELADAGSLRGRLKTIDWPDLHAVLVDLLHALAHAHARGVLHLDLKPANVLFGGRRPGAKLGDFGMGVVGPANPDEDFVRGTPHFMAPEQVRGRWDELGPWTDLYALGCLAWRGLTGEVPFVRSTAAEVLAAQVFGDPGPFRSRIEAPAGIEGWVRQLLNKDPEHRLRFAADAADALREVAEAEAPVGFPDWRIAERDAPAEVSPVVGLGLAAVRDPPFVGRTGERAALWDALGRASQGEVQLAVLRGPVGVGKSRLARWLGVRAHELGLGLVLTGSHHARTRTLGVYDALRSAFPVDPRSPDSEGELGTRLMTRGLPPHVARDAAALLVHGPSGETSDGRPWWEAVGDLVQAVGVERTPVVLLDDVQWGEGSLECLLALVRSGRLAPSLWVLCAEERSLADRPGELELLTALAELPECRSIELGPLSEHASAALSRRMLVLDPSVSGELVRRGGRSPLALVTLVQDWARRGALEPGPGGFRLREGPDASPPVPAPELRPGWLEMLEVGALLGPEVDGLEWQLACAELGQEPRRGTWLELLRARVMRRVDRGPREDRLAFTDPLLREALVAEAEARGAAPALHLACARAIDPSQTERRGRHLMGAGRPEEAVPLLLRALEDVEEVGATGALLDLVASGLAPDDPRRSKVVQGRVELLLTTGRAQEAQAVAVDQRRLAGDRPVELFAAERSLARAALEQGAPAFEHVLAAERWAAAAGDDVVLAQAAALGSQHARAERRFEDARALVAHVSGLALPWRPSLELQLEAILVEIGAGWTRPARAALDRLATSVAARHARRDTAALGLVSADLHLLTGDPAAAILEYRAARRRFRALGDGAEWLAQAGLAAALAATDRPEDAASALERVPDRPWLRLTLRRAIADLALNGGDLGWPNRWRATRELLDSRVAGLDPGLRGMLEVAANKNPREERSREVQAAGDSLRRPL